DQLVVLSTTDGQPSLQLGWAGKALQVWLLVGAVAILTNLERTFRASVGTIRWKIKFMIIGLAVLFVVRIYSSSQFLLYSKRQINVSLLFLVAVTLPVVCLLMTRSLVREGAFNVTVYPSPTVLRNSVTALLAGAYLLLVGVLAQIVTWLG